MPDLLNAMRQFRFLDDKRRVGVLSTEEDNRWRELKVLVQGANAAPSSPGPAQAAAAPKEATVNPEAWMQDLSGAAAPTTFDYQALPHWGPDGTFYPPGFDPLTGAWLDAAYEQAYGQGYIWDAAIQDWSPLYPSASPPEEAPAPAEASAPEAPSEATPPAAPTFANPRFEATFNTLTSSLRPLEHLDDLPDLPPPLPPRPQPAPAPASPPAAEPAPATDIAAAAPQPLEAAPALEAPPSVEPAPALAVAPVAEPSPAPAVAVDFAEPALAPAVAVDFAEPALAPAVAPVFPEPVPEPSVVAPVSVEVASAPAPSAEPMAPAPTSSALTEGAPEVMEISEEDVIEIPAEPALSTSIAAPLEAPAAVAPAPLPPALPAPPTPVPVSNGLPEASAPLADAGPAAGSFGAPVLDALSAAPALALSVNAFAAGADLFSDPRIPPEPSQLPLPSEPAETPLASPADFIAWQGDEQRAVEGSAELAATPSSGAPLELEPQPVPTWQPADQPSAGAELAPEAPAPILLANPSEFITYNPETAPPPAAEPAAAVPVVELDVAQAVESVEARAPAISLAEAPAPSDWPPAQPEPLEELEVESIADEDLPAVVPDGPALSVVPPPPPPATPASASAELNVRVAVPLEPVVAPEQSAESTDAFIRGEHRVIVHTLEGVVKRGMLRDANLDAEAVALEVVPGQGPESLPTARLKAVFFLMAPGSKPPATDGQKLRVTFSDERQVAGFVSVYRPQDNGFFMVPADTRTNTARIYIYRSAVKNISRS